MERTLKLASNVLPDVIKNTHLNLSLEGWPAAVSVIVICGTIISIYAINATHPGESASISEPLAV